MTKTSITALPAQPTNAPTIAACTCGRWDFMGLDNAGMRAEIARHLDLSPAHA